MLRLSAVCLASLLLLQAPYSAAQAVPVSAVADATLAQRIEATIGGYYKASDPGATIIVTREGKTVFRKAYGMADVVTGTPMEAGMSLRLGSITKQFTAVSILMLAEEGKLAVSDDITKFLPDYPTKGKHISIEHLLTHTSGIVSYTSKPGFISTSKKDMTVQGMIDTFKDDALEFEPGTKYKYNNSAYFLLGAIIEKVSGLSYPKFVEQRIFVPLGMSQSAFEGYERSAPQRAAGHSRGEKGYAHSESLSMTQPYSAGSLVSTIDDMARWDAAITAGKLLKPASWKQAFTPYHLADGKSTNYGYGWEVSTLQGVPMIAHGGGINGFSTYALRLPEQKVYVAVLTNLDGGMVRPEVVASKTAAVVIGKPFENYKAVTLDAKSLDALTGVYKVDETTTVTVRRDKDKLTVQRSGRGQTEAQPYSAHGVFIADTLTHIEFDRDAKGEVNQMTVHDGDTVVVRPRIGPVPAERKEVQIAAALFDTYIGRYELAPGFVIEISREGDKYMTQATGQGKIEMFASGDMEFFLKVVDAQLHFKKNADGTVGMVLHQGGREMPTKRLQ